jgi:phage terminase small subunit
MFESPLQSASPYVTRRKPAPNTVPLEVPVKALGKVLVGRRVANKAGVEARARKRANVLDPKIAESKPVHLCEIKRELAGPLDVSAGLKEPQKGQF